MLWLSRRSTLNDMITSFARFDSELMIFEEITLLLLDLGLASYKTWDILKPHLMNRNLRREKVNQVISLLERRLAEERSAQYLKQKAIQKRRDYKARVKTQLWICRRVAQYLCISELRNFILVCKEWQPIFQKKVQKRYLMRREDSIKMDTRLSLWKLMCGTVFAMFLICHALG